MRKARAGRKTGGASSSWIIDSRQSRSSVPGPPSVPVFRPAEVFYALSQVMTDSVIRVAGHSSESESDSNQLPLQPAYY